MAFVNGCSAWFPFPVHMLPTLHLSPSTLLPTSVNALLFHLWVFMCSVTITSRACGRHRLWLLGFVARSGMLWSLGSPQSHLVEMPIFYLFNICSYTARPFDLNMPQSFFLYFWGRMSLTDNVTVLAKDKLEFLILLPLPKCWNYKYAAHLASSPFRQLKRSPDRHMPYVYSRKTDSTWPARDLCYALLPPPPKKNLTVVPLLRELGSQPGWRSGGHNKSRRPGHIREWMSPWLVCWF